MRMYLGFFISIFLTFTSCVTILHSLVTRDNIITDNRIHGTWISSDEKRILVQKLMDSKFKNIFSGARSDNNDFTPQDSVFYTKHYVVSYRENNLDYIWIAGMVKIKDQYYLNLQPEECLDSNEKEVYDLSRTTSTSSVAKLTWMNENTPVLNFLNGNNIKKIILNGRAQIKYEYDPLFESFVITASPEELELFLERYGNNENLYEGGNVMTLKRKN